MGHRISLISGDPRESSFFQRVSCGPQAQCSYFPWMFLFSIPFLMMSARLSSISSFNFVYFQPSGTFTTDVKKQQLQ
jgi:hypothetical protein